MNLSNTVLSSSEAADVLGIHPLSIQKLIYSGALAAEKIANRWLIPKDELTEFAKTYNPTLTETSFRSPGGIAGQSNDRAVIRTKHPAKSTIEFGSRGVPITPFTAGVVEVQKLAGSNRLATYGASTTLPGYSAPQQKI